MRYYLIAGESSGDLHGSNLITGLQVEDPEAVFRIVGGDLMAQATEQVPVLHTSQMSFMGFVEVLFNLRTIRRNLKQVKQDLLNYNPDCVILIDFPGFNLRIAEFCKEHELFVCYYISPKIWAWNEKRVLKIKAVVDRMFCILPFEKDFYAKWGMKVDYVGNPLLDALDQFLPEKNFKYNHGLGLKPVIALLPGSRKMEIEKLLPRMLAMQTFFPGYQFVIAGAPNFTIEYYQKFLKDCKDVPVLFGATYDILINAEAAIVTSGTATLETALLKIPQVVVYQAHWLSVWLAKRLVKIKYISLVNLIMDFMIVRELIQEDFNNQNLHEELNLLLNDRAYRENMLQNYEGLNQKMGGPGSSARTAKLIFSALQDRQVNL